jgi:4'-phosphopantetheinyl transferase
MSSTILYTDYNYSIYESLLEIYATILPQNVIDKVSTFRRWQDKQAFILGRLLIWKGLKFYNYEDTCLNRLQINNYGKPYIDQQVFFNVSHAGKYVVCAFDMEKVGIDIEEIRPVSIDDFSAIFSEQEKYKVSTADNPLQQFYKFWTIKESVIKAEGKGLAIPMNLVNVSGEGAVQSGEMTWYIQEIDAFQNYCCVIATSSILTMLTLQKVNFSLVRSREN